MHPIPVSDIQSRFPAEGLFKDKSWLLSPQPLALDPAVVDQIRQIGPLVARFNLAANQMYLDYKAGDPSLAACAVLDMGKPDSIVSLGLNPAYRDQVTRVIRPDIMLTADGLKITELDSLPGGIGVTGWLNKLYAEFGWPVIGGATGMVDGFARIIDGGNVYISRESQDYRPEVAWLLGQLAAAQPQSTSRLIDTWTFNSQRDLAATIYRYFELWDLDNVENVQAFIHLATSGAVTFTAPVKAFLEEKLWLALLWSPGLRTQWRQRLGHDAFASLQSLVPRGWILDPQPIPFFAEYPELGIQNWNDLKTFSQKERRLVIKISGFSQLAWGSRGVYIGHDLPGAEWHQVIDEALRDFHLAPRIMQRFSQASRFDHPYYDRDTGQTRIMSGRARLCPYYFVDGPSVSLGGILATICPEDKKILHGMTDAILVPCIQKD
jgi:hypothetical protein